MPLNSDTKRIKDRRLVLLQFPEYKLDASALIEADIYYNNIPTLIITSSGKTIDIADYLTRSDFRDYYFSIVNEKKFAERIAKYSTTEQMDQKLKSIRDNYVTNSDLTIYKGEIEEKHKKSNSNISDITDRYNDFIGTTLPTLTTNSQLSSKLENYVTKENQTSTLLNYLTISDYNTNIANYFTKDEINNIKDTINTSINNVNKRFENYTTTIDFNNEVNKKMNSTLVESKLSQLDTDIKANIAENYYNKTQIDSIKSDLTQSTSSSLENYVTKSYFQTERDKLYSSEEVDNLVKDIKDTHYTKSEEDEKHNKLKHELDEYKAIGHTSHQEVKDYIKENNKSYNTKEEIKTIKQGLDDKIDTKLNEENFNTFVSSNTSTINDIKKTASDFKEAYDNHIINFNNKTVEYDNKLGERYTKDEISELMKLYYKKSEIDLQNNTFTTSISGLTSDLSNLTGRVNTLASNKLDKNIFDALDNDTYRKSEIDTKIKSVNAYNKPEMDKKLKDITDNVSGISSSLSNLETNVGRMYTNTILDTKFLTHKTLLDDYGGKITALQNNTVPKSVYDENNKKIELGFSSVYNKSQISVLFNENNKNFYNKEETNTLANNKIADYDRGIRNYIDTNLNSRLTSYVTTSAFETYKTDVATKTELSEKISDLEEKTYTKEQVDLIKTGLISGYKSYTDDKVSSELNKYTTETVNEKIKGFINNTDAKNLFDERINGYVTKETFYDRLNKLPSSDDLDSSIDTKMGELIHTVRHLISDDVNTQINKFYDYVIENKKLSYSRLKLDSLFKNFADRNLSQLRYKYTLEKIDKLSKRFINYFTKDEIDSKFNFYFERVNIADATLYYTAEQTERMLAGKVDTNVFRLFTENVYSKTHIDTTMDGKVNVSVYNTAIQGLTSRVSTLESNYNSVNTSISTLTSNINNKISNLETQITENKSKNTEVTTEISGKLTEVEKKVEKFKTEEQIKDIITSSIRGKLDTSTYDVDKASFVTTSKLSTEIRSIKDDSYTRATIDGKISTVDGKIKSESEINSMIDDKLSTFSSSSDVENKIESKINESKANLLLTIEQSTNEKLLPYAKTEYITSNYISKDTMTTKETDFNKKVEDAKIEILGKVTELKTKVGTEYLKLSGGKLSGPLKIQKFKISDEGIIYDNSPLLVFKIGSRDEVSIKYSELGHVDLDSVRVVSKDGLYHYKNGEDYKFITEETFNPFKNSVYLKTDIDSKLSDKVDTTVYTEGIKDIKDNYVKTDTLTSNISDLTSKINERYTKSEINKQVEDNYLKINVFETFKTNNKIEYEKHVRDKVKEASDTLTSSISTLTTTVTQNKNAVDTSLSTLNTKIEQCTTNYTSLLDGKVSTGVFNIFKNTVYTKTESDKTTDEIKKLIKESEKKVTKLESDIPTLTSGKLDKTIFNDFKTTVNTKKEISTIKTALEEKIDSKVDTTNISNVLRYGSQNNYIGKSLHIEEIVHKGETSNFKLNKSGLHYSVDRSTWYPIISYQNISEGLLFPKGVTRDPSWSGYDIADTLVLGKDNTKSLLLGDVFLKSKYTIDSYGVYSGLINESDINFLIDKKVSDVSGKVTTLNTSVENLTRDNTVIKESITNLSNDKLNSSTFRTEIANYLTTSAFDSAMTVKDSQNSNTFARRTSVDSIENDIRNMRSQISSMNFYQIKQEMNQWFREELSRLVGDIANVLNKINGDV